MSHRPAERNEGENLHSASDREKRTDVREAGRRFRRMIILSFAAPLASIKKKGLYLSQVKS